MHNFLGSEKNPDGTAKYDTNKVPTEKLAEFAKLPTAAEAYRAAVDYLMGQSKETPTSTSTTSSGVSGSGTKTSTGKTSTEAKTSSPTDTNVGTTGVTSTSIESTKTWLIDQAKTLNTKGGFAKTNTSFEAFSQQVNNAKTKEDLEKLAEMIKPAIEATPMISIESKLTQAKHDAFSPYGSLTPAQKEVVKKSPLMKNVLEITRQIQALSPVDNTNQSREDAVR